MPSGFEYAKAAGFPSFGPLFERAQVPGVSAPLYPLYLILLNHPGSADSRFALTEVRKAITTSSDVTREVTALFSDDNWRPHLVGAMVILLRWANFDAATVPRDPMMLNALWQAFDRESWVTPQLAATAYLCDPGFEAEARRRIEAHCWVGGNGDGSSELAKRLNAPAPTILPYNLIKTLAALVALCRKLTSAAEPNSWLDRALAEEIVREALANDYDNGERIALGWLAGVEAILSGVPAG